MGTVLKHRLVSEGTFMDLFARLIVYSWEKLEPVVAIMRRTRGDGQYDDLEYLALRARTWQKLHPRGIFPSDVLRQPLQDESKDADLRTKSPNVTST
jgi:hypothetical protein